MATDKDKPRDLYQILGIDRADPSGAVREAFVKKVALNPPDKFPDEFKALKMAYQTLMDPHARKEYDNLMACGRDIVELMNSAFDLMIRGRFRAAESSFKKIADETGGAPEALMLLGLSQYEQGHFRDAIQTLNELIDRFPRISLYRVNLGNMLRRRYDQIEGNDAKAHAIMRAREQYLKAIENDPGNPMAYVSMAATYATEKNYETAYEWAEKAIREHGREDMEVLDPLLYGFVILTLLNDSDRMQQQVLRIEDAIPEYPDARDFAVGILVEAAIGLVKERKLEAVRLLILAGMRLAPKNRNLPKMLKDTDLAFDADLEWPRFSEDFKILTPVKEMADVLMKAFLMASNRESVEKAAVEFLKKLSTRTTSEVNQCLIYFNMEYPGIWNLNRDFWNRVSGLGRTRVQSIRSSSQLSRIFWTIFIIFAVARLLHLLFPDL